MSASALVVSRINEVVIGYGTGAVELRDAALDIASDVAMVANEVQQCIAASAMQELAVVRRLVEKSRKEVKEPVLELGRNIDAKAKEFVADIEREEARIGRLVSDYQAKIRAEAAERERKVREEAFKIEMERIEAQREASKIADFDKRKAAMAEVDAKREQVQQQLAVAVQEPAKPDGIRVKEVWDYTVTDAAKAYAARPDFFDLVPKRRVILDCLVGGMRECPGLHIKMETKVGAV